MAAAGTRAGTGYVDLEPQLARDFHETIARKLNEKLTPALKKVGDRSGKDFGKGVASGIDRGGIAQMLKRRFARIGDDAGKELASRISKGAKRAEGDMFGLANAVREVERRSRKASAGTKALGGDMFGIAKAAREAGKGLRFSHSEAGAWTRRADGATKSAGRLRGRLKNLGYEFGSLAKGLRTSSGGFSGFDGVMARVNRSAQFFRNILRLIKWPVFIAGLGLSLQGLSAFTAGVVAATGALGSLSGALVALPAAALAGAQAFGALKLATAGVGDAVKAALDAEVQGGGQAVDVMKQQKEAAERVADAKRNLTDAQERAKQAQEDLTDARESARRSLQDMRLEADRSRDSEEGATLQLVQARKDLQKALRDPESTGLDIRFAEEALDQARYDLRQTRIDAKRAREDYRKAEQGGVKQMPEVVAAEEAKADAKRAVADADRDLKKATEDASEAMKEQGSAASAFHDKMSQLPPAAQKFARFLVGLKPKLDALRATSAQGFFPGAEVGLKGAMKNFGVFRGLIGGTSKALGGLAAKAGQKLGSAAWGKDLARLGKLNTRIIGRLGGSFMNLADALRHTLVAAEPFLDWFSGSIKEFTGWIKAEAEAGRETGRLGEFFDRTRETMELLGPILRGVGGALLNIGEAARPLGNEILGALGDSAEGWRKWTDSTKGQNSLAKYFKDAKPAIFEMGRLIGAIGKAFFRLGAQDGVANLLRLIRTELVPAMEEAAGFFTGFASGFLEQFRDLRKDGVPRFDAFLRTLASHAGEAALKIAHKLWDTFWGASPLGKAAFALWFARFGFVRKLGGAVGERLATALGRRFLMIVGPYFAADGALGSVIDRRMGKLKGFFGKWGGKLGVALVAGLVTLGLSDASTRKSLIDFGRGLGQWIADGISEAINWAFDRINDLLDKANFASALGVDAPELPKVDLNWLRNDFFMYGPEGSGELPEPKTEKAKRGFERFRKQVGKEAELTRQLFRKQLAPLPDIAGRNAEGMIRQTLPRLETLKTQGGKKIDTFASRGGGSFGSLAGAAKDAFENIQNNIRGALKGLGQKGNLPHFNLKLAPKLLNMLPPIERQSGGFIVPGQGSGDTFRTALPPGSFILNREATAEARRQREVGFQGGGLMPVALEPKEGVFLPPEVKKIGAAKLEAWNREVPRFQEGGIVALGRRLQEQGYQVGEHPAFGGVAPVHSPTSYHYRGMALDVNADGKAPSEAYWLDKLYAQLKKVPGVVELLWRVADHFDHLHVAMSGSGGPLGALLAGPAPKIKRVLLDGPEGPLKSLGQKAIDRVHAAAQKFVGSQSAPGGIGSYEGFSGGWVQMLETIAGERGWSVRDWKELVRRESGGNPAAVNPESGAYGLGQFLGSTKAAYAKYGATSSNGVDQIRAMAKYIADRYGDPTAALAFHDANNWYQRGGLLKLQKGGLLGRLLGRVPGFQSGGAFKGNINRKYPGATLQTEASKWFALPELPSYVLAALAEAAGDYTGTNMPGWTMAQMTKGEGGGKPGSMGDDNGDGKPDGYGWLAITRPWGDSYGVGALGGYEEMLNPVKNAYVAAKMYGDRGLAPWYGDSHVTNTNAHYDGNYDLRNALGGATFAQAIKGEAPTGADKAAASGKPLPKTVSGEYVDYSVVDRGDEPDELKAVKRKYKVQTAPLTFPGRPATFEAVQKEMAKRRVQLDEYTAAAGDVKRKNTKEALLANAARLRKRIRELRAVRSELMIKQHMGFKATREAAIDQQGDRFEELRETAEQIMALEPEDEAGAKAWVRDRGQPAWKEAFGQLGKWRNAILGGQEFAVARLAGLAQRIQAVKELKKTNPTFYKRYKGRIPAYEAAAKQVREVFNPGPPPSGRLEDSLTEVQGGNKERGKMELPSTPEPGRFGGLVWDTQMQLRELGLKLNQVGSGDSEGDSERVGLLEELLRQSNQRELVKTSMFEVFRDFEKQYSLRDLPPFGGRFHSGGVVPGPANQEVMALLRGQETVLTPEQMAGVGEGLGRGAPTIENLSIVVHEDGTATVDLEGREFKAAVRREVGDMPTRLLVN